ncbi:ATP-dependent DNA helicase RecG [Desulfitobacterium hafniense]|uniref:ATP-dependent DNA helicase RecG n=1 Tax=Desulfitobacterium hafniense TaxID=49338 RepID=UPI000377D698|nr:ATP-dependent DNA helicase RecG [Desulfitobacterium hafniense]
MIGNQGKIVLNHLQRAIAAEEKQGCCNTGVIGGFHLFLKGILSRLEQLEKDEDFKVLKDITGHYKDWSPLQRRQALAHLRRFIEEHQEPEEHQKLEAHQEPGAQGPTSAQPGNQSWPEKEPRVQNSLEPSQPSQPSQPSHISPVSEKSDPDKKERTAKPSPPRSLQFLKGVGPERAKLLAQIGLHTVKDLFFYFPRRYEDRSLQSIGELKDGELASVAGKVVAGQIARGKLKVVKLSIEQDGRLVYAVWFNQTYILKQYPVGTSVIVTGKVRWQQRVPEIQATDIQKAGGAQPAAILPVYSETARLSSKVIRTIVQGVLDQAPELFPEFLPPEEGKGWVPRAQAYREIHFPRTFHSLGQARERLVFEEVLFLQLSVARLRSGVQRENSPQLKSGESLVQRFLSNLPFELTQAQKRVIQEIFRDMANTQGMARLVQGDVGSGKTAVAMAALLMAVGSGYQGAMMAPTEILALQHYQSLAAAFNPLGLHVVCLLGSQTKSERDKILTEIAYGKAHVIVGTHALIQESVQFHSLGLAITDEQHRFGVKQRTSLQTKGENPHVLVLTATPIPRTLALTLYGDLQLSALDEMPQGRKPIMTRKLTERGRPSLEKFMEEQMEKGRQIYVVCPLVEESENVDLISATERFQSLQERFPNRRVSLLHGRMKGVQKEEIMDAFQKGEVDILVSTTVVEVGVNVPNATVMVIEGAERFGLAQLHQLRGRVGRGSEQSYCFLLSDAKNSRRLEVLCETQDGFKIAEEDLKIRGAGELLGTRQHGVMELRLADLSRDGRLVEQAYQLAQKVLTHPDRYPGVWHECDQFFSLENIGLH